MPRSIEAMDRMLAQDMRVLASSDARALNAFFDFKRDVIYVYALGRDAKASARRSKRPSQERRTRSSPVLRALLRPRSPGATVPPSLCRRH
jgi:hypothetical protein